MRRKLEPAERLIVAADNVDVLELAEKLQGTGVYLKVNSALRDSGYHLILEIQEFGLKTFADLKLNDIPETLGTDGSLLSAVNPDLVTVMCQTGAVAMHVLRNWLPNTEVLGVTVLTSLSDYDSIPMFGCTVDKAVKRFACMAKDAGLGGVIASAKEAEGLRKLLGDDMTINTPAIRPSWAVVVGDDQNKMRVTTPAEAIRLGADRIIVGRPIVQSEDPRGAVLRTIDEIAAALEISTAIRP